VARAVAALEDQAGVSTLIENASVGFGACRQRMRRVDGDLVGERRQGRQDPGAAHDDAGGRVAGLVHGHAIAGELAVGRLVDGRMDDRVGERDVLARDPLLEVHDVVCARLVSALGALPVVRPRRKLANLTFM
jgi:hypothetical protein